MAGRESAPSPQLICKALGGSQLGFLATGEPNMIDVDRGYAVGWGTLALLNAGLAQGKGHSRLIWFLLSLFLGPLATFILVVFIDHKPRGGGTA
jgi:hypothetical protein